MTVERPVMRYFGSKWRIAPWIISHFPNHETYVEPFGGGGSVLLRKGSVPVEVYNDLNGDVVTFFRVLRERPSELMAQLKATPYARAEFDLSYKDAEDELEAARRFFVRAWQSYGGPRDGRQTGWKRQKTSYDGSRKCIMSEWAKAKDLHAAATRFLNVQIENRDALEVINYYDGESTLFYVDPPYPSETISKYWANRAYACDLMIEDHVHLLNSLNKIRGAAVLSSYPNPLYDEQLADWRKVTKPTRTMSHGKAIEALYIKC